MFWEIPALYVNKAILYHRLTQAAYLVPTRLATVSNVHQRLFVCPVKPCIIWVEPTALFVPSAALHAITAQYAKSASIHIRCWQIKLANYARTRWSDVNSVPRIQLARIASQGTISTLVNATHVVTQSKDANIVQTPHIAHHAAYITNCRQTALAKYAIPSIQDARFVLTLQSVASNAKSATF